MSKRMKRKAQTPAAGSAEGDMQHRARVPEAVRRLPDPIVSRVCEMMINERFTTDAISVWLRAKGHNCSREKVYPILSEAMDRGFLRISPPVEADLRDKLGRKYSGAPSNILVVNAGGPNTTENIAAKAAELTLDLIRESGKDRVQVGFGAGDTIKRVAKDLAKQLRHESGIPRLVLRALGTGFAPTDPSTCATTFFSYFSDLADRNLVTHIGLFANPFVRWTRYREAKAQQGVAPAFEGREEIDIIIMTIANANDEHALLRQFLKLASPTAVRKLMDLGWVGDVLWRPFSATGPITRSTSIRPITVFELEELVHFARTPGKRLILVVGPCPFCGRSKSLPLRALLTEPTLQICTDLVTDADTANELLAPPREHPPAGRQNGP